MKAATQSCFGKKVLSKFRQNPQKAPAKDPFSSKATGLKSATLPKKSHPKAYLGPELFYYVLEFQKHPFSSTLLNCCFCIKYYRKLNISLVKKMSGLLKRPVDLRNLITTLITSLFRLLELLLEPYRK